MRRLPAEDYKYALEAKRYALLRSLDQTREQAATASIRLRESRMLWIVEAALQALADGTYGRCLFCQHRIPRKRLASFPWSAYCESCEKLAEAYVNRPGPTAPDLSRPHKDA